MATSVPGAAATPTSSASGTPSVHVALDNTLGAVFIGLIIAAILFGIVNIQTVNYFQTSKGDPRYLKCMIVLLWVLITSQLALVAHYNYYTLITNFANLSIVGKVTWSWSTPVLSSETSDFIIRLYYSRRIWILSDRNRFLTAGAVIWNFVAYGSSIAFTAKLFPLNSLVEISGFSWLLYLSLGSGVAADLWTATSVCYFLRKDKSGVQRTDTLVNKLTIYIVGTGLLTSICAICALITYAAMPNNSVFVAIYSNLAKLYFNALLANLNSRKRLRDDMAIDFSDQEMGTSQMRRNMNMNMNTGTHFTSGLQCSSATEYCSEDNFTRSRLKSESMTGNSASGEREGDEPLDTSIKTEKHHQNFERDLDSDSCSSSLPA